MVRVYTILIFTLFIEGMAAQKQQANPQLNYVNEAKERYLVPLTSSNKYKNQFIQFEPNYSDFRKWKKAVNPYAEQKKAMNGMEVSSDLSWLTSNNDGLVWLGHASFFLRLNGVHILIDPVFNSISILHKRYSSIPFAIKDLPQMDYVLLSHNHRDHLSKKTLQQIKRSFPQVQVKTGLAMSSLISSLSGLKHIEEAGWYQWYTVNHHQLKIAFLPSQHWSKRGLFDYNDHLWGAFLIQCNGKTIYFSGDTGYNEHLKEVGELFQIDYALIGIGAYQPEWFMHVNHISPNDALKAATEMGAKVFIPMHFGTFDLSDEPVCEPLDQVKKSYSQSENKNLQLCTPKIGEWVPLSH